MFPVMGPGAATPARAPPEQQRTRASPALGALGQRANPSDVSRGSAAADPPETEAQLASLFPRRGRRRKRGSWATGGDGPDHEGRNLQREHPLQRFDLGQAARRYSPHGP